MKHPHCLAPSRLRAEAGAPIGPDLYARLFPDAPTLEADDTLLFALGRSGGLCDCGDGDDDAASLGDEAAGWPFFGQFVAHDITADRSALKVGSGVDPSQLRNARSPRLNLECLYGDGPIGHPFLYQRGDPAKLLTGPEGTDLLRNHEGTAIIGDPRNDSHLFMSQMHLSFVRAHNALVDQLRESGISSDRVFDTAVRELRWHYQTVVLEEFLPRLIGSDLTAALLAGDRRYYRPAGGAYIPLEFADAAYRYGHGQIRHRYRINGKNDPLPIFPDLMGFRPIPPNRQVDWWRLFDVADRPPADRARRMDGKLVGALIELPGMIIGDTEVEEFHSLAVRDLERGRRVALPSGETLARRMGVEPLTREAVGVGSLGWQGETPLWFYVLREAAVHGGGDRLGPVGGRIVGEVLVGLLDLDAESVRHAPAEWRPSASLADLLSGSGRTHSKDAR